MLSPKILHPLVIIHQMNHIYQLIGQVLINIFWDVPNMLYKIFIYLVGFGLATSGGISIISYLNLFAMGYTMPDYLLFIMKRPDCYFLLIGIILITWAVFSNYGKK